MCKTPWSITLSFAGLPQSSKQRFFPRLAHDTVGAYALSEPDSGSDAFGMATQAKLDGDSFILNGRKMWITNGAEAGLYLLFANADPSKGYKGITGFIVERDFPGFSVGKKEDKLGIRASSTCELILEDVRVPRANVVSEVGQGYKVAIETLNEGRIGIGAQMVGLAQGAFDAALEYGKERKQFGKAIADFQAIQFQLAEMATDIEAARLDGLQHRAHERSGTVVCSPGGDDQVFLFASRRTCRLASIRNLWWRWFH